MAEKTASDPLGKLGNVIRGVLAKVCLFYMMVIIYSSSLSSVVAFNSFISLKGKSFSMSNPFEF